jgi:hypothetical protein
MTGALHVIAATVNGDKLVDAGSVYFKEAGPHSRVYVIFKTGADTQFVPDAK